VTQTRYSKAQLIRRRQAVLRLYIAGWSVTQIRDALGLKVASTVTEDLRKMYPDREFRRGRKKGVPDSVNWKDEPEPTAMNDVVLRTVRGFLSEMASQNYRNALAWAVTQAKREGARQWLTEAEHLTADLEKVTQALRSILGDPDYRRQMAKTEAGRDDLRSETLLVNEGLVIHAIDLLEAGLTQTQVGQELDLADNSMRLAAVVAVARERIRAAHRSEVTRR
jgi:hypothetical protein